jgi:hypothetical protein
MWIERYRRQAEARYQRLDDLLAAMPDDNPNDNYDSNPNDRRQP